MLRSFPTKEGKEYLSQINRPGVVLSVEFTWAFSYSVLVVY